jgi:hypothetical protein
MINVLSSKKGLLSWYMLLDDCPRCIINGKADTHYTKFIGSLKNGEETFDLTEEGNLEVYL